MARYDVYENPTGVGYLVEVQSDLLDGLQTRAVLPLVPHTPDLKVVRRLNPKLTIDGKEFALFTHLIATVPASRLGQTKMNMRAHDYEITSALDMLFQGF